MIQKIDSQKTVRHWQKQLGMLQADRKIDHISWLEELILLKYHMSQRQSTDLMQSLQNTNDIFHRNRISNFKICMKKKTQNSLNNLEKEELSLGIILSDFRLYY